MIQISEISSSSSSHNQSSTICRESAHFSMRSENSALWSGLGQSHKNWPPGPVCRLRRELDLNV